MLGSRRVIVRAIDGELEPASWQVVLAKPDQLVSLTYPEPLLLEPDLPPPPDAPPPKPRRDRGPAPLLASGGLLLAGGVAMACFGISRWARGETESRSNTMELILTSDRRPAGVGLVGAGIASVTLGATLMALELVRARRQQPRRLALGVDPLDLSLSVSGRF